jgi:hypothetical protein
MQRRLPSALAEAGIIDTQHRTAGPAQEFYIVQVRRQIARSPRTKQDNRGLTLGPLCGHGLLYGSEPEAAQDVALGTGESHLVSTQAKIRWHLIAIPVRQENEGIEEAMQHRRSNA